MNTDTKILFIGKRFYTNKDTLLEQFGRVYQLPAHWARSGCEVLLWLVDYHTRQPVAEQNGTLRILSTPMPGLSPFKALAAWWRLRPQVVVVAGDCYIGLLGWILARLCGARFVFDVYDKYDEFAGYRRILGLDLFRFLRRRADQMWFCSRGLQALYAGEGNRASTVFVANGVDDTRFARADRLVCRASLKLPLDQLLVAYFGSMEPDRGVQDLLDAVDILRGQGLDLRLLICGRPDPSLALDCDWIIYRGMVPHADMPCYLNASDLLVVPYRESAIMDMGASCKIAEYLMCERPLVSTRTGNFVSNFPRQATELGGGLCRPSDPADLARAIALQLEEKRVLTRPTDMSWSQIAAAALAAMGTHEPAN